MVIFVSWEKIVIVGLVIVCMALSFGCVDNNDTSSASSEQEYEQPSEPDNIVRRYTEVLVDKHIELAGNTGGYDAYTHGPFKKRDKITFTISNIEGGNRDVYFNYPFHEDVYVFKEGTYTYELESNIDARDYLELWFRNDDGYYKELDFKVEVTYDDVEMRGYNRVINLDDVAVLEEI